MKLLRLAIGLFAALALVTTAVSAAPGPFAPGKSHEQRKPYKHHHHEQRRHHQQDRRYVPPREHRQWQQPRNYYQQPRNYYQQPRQYQQPHRPHQQHRYPPHRDQLRRDIYRSSHHLHRGPALPRHVHLVVGRPLPHGWSHRVPPGHVKHLPHYAGYEWHSAGRDLVLVAVTTGMVYSILDNVIN